MPRLRIGLRPRLRHCCGSGSEARLAHAFIELADTGTDDFDVVEFLMLLTGRCVELLPVSAACALLDEGHGQLALAAASGEHERS